jgi:hypothetical protein
MNFTGKIGKGDKSMPVIIRQNDNTKIFSRQYANLRGLDGFIGECSFKESLGENAYIAYMYIKEKYPKVKEPEDKAQYFGKAADRMGEVIEWGSCYMKDYIEDPKKFDKAAFIKRYIELNCEYTFEPKKARLVEGIPLMHLKDRITPLDKALYFYNYYNENSKSGKYDVFSELKIKNTDRNFIYDLIHFVQIMMDNETEMKEDSSEYYD